jgi:hypothetical protein
MFSKLVFDMDKALIEFKNLFVKYTNEKISDNDAKEISLLFEIL